MRKSLPLTFALGGGALFTWLDAECFFFVFPRLPFVLLFLAWLVPWRTPTLRDPWRLVPLAMAASWMLALPWLPTGRTKRFVLAVEGLEEGMSEAEMRARMEPFLELGTELVLVPESAWGYPRPSATTPVFFSENENQFCQVLLGPDGVLAVEFEYVD